MRMKRGLLLFFMLLAAVVLGGLLAMACENIGWLSWMAYSRTIGFDPESPLVLDLGIFRFSFGFAVDVSVAQIITMGGAAAAYYALGKRG